MNENVLPAVSGGDLPGDLEGYAAAVSPGDAGMPPDTEGPLAETNALLSAILFVLLFEWCEKKIRGAVSKMAGRQAR